jgi:hypothetical protein
VAVLPGQACLLDQCDATTTDNYFEFQFPRQRGVINSFYLSKYPSGLQGKGYLSNRTWKVLTSLAVALIGGVLWKYGAFVYWKELMKRRPLDSKVGRFIMSVFAGNSLAELVQSTVTSIHALHINNRFQTILSPL